MHADKIYSKMKRKNKITENKKNEMIYPIVIVGAGASGLMAAMTAAASNKKIIIIEKNDKIGKKIAATGNGRCNLTNIEQSTSDYYNYNAEFVSNALEAFSNKSAINFFEDNGLLTRNKQGYIYPKSMQAQSVNDLFSRLLFENNVELITGTEVVSAKKINDVFVLELSNGSTIKATKLILACGSRANPKLSSDGLGYKLAKDFGHTIITPLPALCGLKAKKIGNLFKIMSGVRADVTIMPLIDGKAYEKESGELQLTDYGVSGIVVFQVSRLFSKSLYEHKNCELIIDFVNDISADKLAFYLRQRNIGIGDALDGLLNKKLTSAFLQFLNIKNKMKINDIDDITLSKIIHTIKNFRIKIEATNDYDNAQVCTGGIDLCEVNLNCESKLVSNLYFCGEILDVDGKCGGHNLQFAWSTGYIVGKELIND